MKTLKELREARFKAIESAKAIQDAVKAESREYTDEEIEQIDSFLAQSDSLDAEIKRIEAAQERESRIEREYKAATQSAERVVPPVDGVFPVPPATPKSRIEFPLIGKPKNIQGPRAAEIAHGIGMWSLACLGNTRALRYCHENGIDINAVYEEKVNTTGGYWVPPEFSTAMVDLREQYGVFRQYARIEPMMSETKSRPRHTGGLTAYFIGESAAITESTGSTDQINLVAKDLYVLSRYSGQLNADSAISLGDRLAFEIAYAFARKEDDCGFLGDGTSTYAGIFGLKGKVTAATASLVTANSGTHTDWSQITLAELNQMVGKLPQYADTPNTRWYCHKTFFANVMQTLLYAAGGNTMSMIAGGTREESFLGYPVVVSQVLPSSASTAEVVCFLGDLSLAADFGDRQGISIAFSTEANVGGQSVFERNQIAIRGWERFDINVHDVGDTTNAGPVVGLLTAS